MTDVLILRVRENDRIARRLRPLEVVLRPHWPCDDLVVGVVDDVEVDQVQDAVDAALNKFIRCWECGRWTDRWVVAQLSGVVGKCVWCVWEE